jgi:hypothetical protein
LSRSARNASSKKNLNNIFWDYQSLLEEVEAVGILMLAVVIRSFALKKKNLAKERRPAWSLESRRI